MTPHDQWEKKRPMLGGRGGAQKCQLRVTSENLAGRGSTPRSKKPATSVLVLAAAQASDACSPGHAGTQVSSTWMLRNQKPFLRVSPGIT